MRKIGISIYPEQSGIEKNIEYLNKTAKLGYDVLFTSWVHMDEQTFKNSLPIYKQVLKKAHDLNFYIIMDVNESVFKYLNIEYTDYKIFDDYKINCLRLDCPLLPETIAMSSYNSFNIDIQLNMSNNDSLINCVFDYQPIFDRIQGAHNFYPLKNSALPLDFFFDSSQRFKDFALNTMAFVGSHVGDESSARGNRECVTLEIQRNMTINTQAKILFATNLIDWVVIGNAFASDEELTKLAQVSKHFISIDIPESTKITTEEENLLLEMLHFRRGDISSVFIRSTQGREKFKEVKMPAHNTKKEYKIGDVAILNDLAGHYKNEVHIFLQDYIDEKGEYNFIFNLEEQIYLLDFILPWSKFRFRK
ncbi:MupG family TIM beta-alpha barrel fold protein [Spiroplasma endosymbiont of Labia minor]|uniref:MupG family TIM beta-alpha barrel fold protein n=1 Tax=Spiroplasma endosymbiont of Labia minor TaxID=3066305 RepID=UPI0030D10459